MKNQETIETIATIATAATAAKTNRCTLCCKETKVLNQGFHHHEYIDERFLVCDSCFAQTRRDLIPNVLLGYYTKLRRNLGIVGIN